MIARLRTVALFCSLLSVPVVGCGSQEQSSEAEIPTSIGDGEIPGAAAGDRGGPGRAGDAADAGSSEGAAGRPADGVSTGSGTAQAGVLTAGAWDDNLNFEHFSAYRAGLLESELPGLMPTTDADHAVAEELFGGERAPRQQLDVALVIDATGSMSDEMRYLQTEFLAISATIEETYPDAAQRWSLIVYRDEGDEYVVRWFDFREKAEDFRDALALQEAGGGGDFPEAPDAALAKMNELSWRSGDDVARLAFLVADAPHHAENAGRLLDAVRAAQGQDVHIYPVASSGIDELTELTMRSTSQLTGGRYLFLTDDSGVGGVHKEPTIPCYFVTRLDHALLRMIDIELTGTHREPDADNVIRTGGDPQDGACALAAGGEVQAF